MFADILKPPSKSVFPPGAALTGEAERRTGDWEPKLPSTSAYLAGARALVGEGEADFAPLPPANPPSRSPPPLDTRGALAGEGDADLEPWLGAKPPSRSPPPLEAGAPREGEDDLAPLPPAKPPRRSPPPPEEDLTGEEDDER